MVVDNTADVVIVKFAVVLPAATVTEVGVVAAPFELPSCTTAPPAGAAAFSVTVPETLFPPTTLVGETDTFVTQAMLIVRSADTELADRAVMDGEICEPTGDVVTVKVPTD